MAVDGPNELRNENAVVTNVEHIAGRNGVCSAPLQQVMSHRVDATVHGLGCFIESARQKREFTIIFWKQFYELLSELIPCLLRRSCLQPYTGHCWVPTHLRSKSASFNCFAKMIERIDSIAP